MENIHFHLIFQVVYLASAAAMRVNSLFNPFMMSAQGVVCIPTGTNNAATTVQAPRTNSDSYEIVDIAEVATRRILLEKLRTAPLGSRQILFSRSANKPTGIVTETKFNALMERLASEAFSIGELPSLVTALLRLGMKWAPVTRFKKLQEASLPFKRIIQRCSGLNDDDWIVLVKETLRLFDQTSFVHTLLYEALCLKKAAEENDVEVLQKVENLPHFHPDLVVELATSVMSCARLSDKDFKTALDLIAHPNSETIPEAQNRDYHLGLIAHKNPHLSAGQLVMLHDKLVLRKRPVLVNVTQALLLAQIAGHPHFDPTARIRTLFFFKNNVPWPSLELFFVALMWLTQFDDKLRHAPRQLLQSFGSYGIGLRFDPLLENGTLSGQKFDDPRILKIINKFFRPLEIR